MIDDVDFHFQKLYFVKPGRLDNPLTDSEGAVKLKCGARDLPKGFL